MTRDSEFHPWERQPDETLQAFQAFAMYRDMGAERSGQRVAVELGKTKALIYRWSKRWSWVDRVKAYNDFQDREWLDLSAERRRDAQLRHLRLAQQVLQKFFQRLVNVNPEDIPLNMLDRLLKVGVETELASLGLPTSVSRIDLDTGEVDALRQKILNMGEGE